MFIHFSFVSRELIYRYVTEAHEPLSLVRDNIKKKLLEN